MENTHFIDFKELEILYVSQRQSLKEDNQLFSLFFHFIYGFYILRSPSSFLIKATNKVPRGTQDPFMIISDKALIQTFYARGADLFLVN